MYLEVLEQEERYGFSFWRLSDRKKGPTNKQAVPCMLRG